MDIESYKVPPAAYVLGVMAMRVLFYAISIFWCVFPSVVLSNEGRSQDAQTVLEVIDVLCNAPDMSGLGAQAALPGSWLLHEEYKPDRTNPRVITLRLVLPDLNEIEVERRQHDGQLRQFRASLWKDKGNGPAPALLAIADGGCTVQSGRAIRAEGHAHRYLDQLDGDLQTLRWTETLQAPWPDGLDTGGIRVGFVDSGLAYDLPMFRGRLARGPDGVPLGYDFWDLDIWPYDGETSRGPFLPIRHGTAVASVFVREAPDAMIVPYKYPRPDMTRLKDLVERAARDGVRILAMPLGSSNASDWTDFEAALNAHDILAIVSAGNNGRDIDISPVYPAALQNEKILTVTSADAFGQLAEGSNWGQTSVDLMVPAENLPIIDFRGASGTASGSSYAVPRVAALTARLLAVRPDLTTAELKQAIISRATVSPFQGEGLLAVGWIPDPLSD